MTHIAICFQDGRGWFHFSDIHWSRNAVDHMDRVKRIWYFGIRAISPEPSLLAHTSSESRETFRQKARSLAPLNGWACAVKICHDGMLEDTNLLDGAHMQSKWCPNGVTLTLLATHCIHTSMNVRKMKFVSYMYLHYFRNDFYKLKSTKNELIHYSFRTFMVLFVNRWIKYIHWCKLHV